MKIMFFILLFAFNLQAADKQPGDLIKAAGLPE